MEKSVIIVGAGPSGLSAALNLIKRGVTDILVIEKSVFPRYKCCAGYVTEKTGREYNKLGLDISKCRYSLIKDFNIVYKFKRRLNITNKFLYTNAKIDRVELDNAFFETAKAAGAEILENTKITSHSPEKNEVTLSDGQTLKYGSLIFADGAVGYGSRYQCGKKKNIAIQLTFPCDKEEQISIHFGVTRRGYGWLSTYGGTANVGLTDVFDPEKDYGKIFTEFLSKLGADADASGLKGAFTPIGVGKAVIFSNVYFVGDAVGACDPLTLSGLRYGLSSGEFCARAIAEKKPTIYNRYIKKLKRRFNFMRFMQKVFYLKVTSFFVFNVLCRMFGGLVSAVFNRFFVNKK